MRRGIDDGARHERPNERRSFANNGEERKEEKFLATRGDLGNHNLAVRVPGTNKETVEGLVEPELPHMVEAEAGSPDANHAPAISARFF